MVLRPDAPIITELRRFLADESRTMMAVTTEGPFPGIGIRPELLSDNGRQRVWSVNRRQAAKVIATWDAEVQQEQDSRS